MKDDRRRAERRYACLAVELSSPAKPARCGVTRNVSRAGLLVVTPSRFVQGERIELRLVLGGKTPRVFDRAGRVVRIDENDPRSTETWRYKLAIALDDALPGSLEDFSKAS